LRITIPVRRGSVSIPWVATCALLGPVVPLALLIGLGLGGSLYYDCFVVSPANLSDKTVILFIAFFHVLAVGTLADLIEKRSRL